MGSQGNSKQTKRKTKEKNPAEQHHRKDDAAAADEDNFLTYHAKKEATKIETKAKDKYCDTYALFVGERESGKTSLIQQFLGKEEAGRNTKPTIGLDYCFARRPKPGGSSSKQTAHVWEVGGSGTCLKEMMAIPLRRRVGQAVVVVVLDLSKPRDALYATKKWIDAVLSLPTAESGRQGPRPDAVPLMIVGNKYDIFRNEDSNIRKSLSQALRHVAYLYRATLVFAGRKDKDARENYRVFSRQRLFSASPDLDRSKLKAVVTNDGPIAIPPQTDSIDKILASLPDGCTTRRDILADANGERAIALWICAFESLFGWRKQDAIVRSFGEEEDKYPQINAPEPKVDAARAEANRRLEKYRRDRDRGREVKRFAE